jgi:hypothetical protein
MSKAKSSKKSRSPRQPLKPSLKVDPPIRTVKDAMAVLAALTLTAHSLKRRAVLHGLAAVGAWMGITELKLGGEDAQLYAGPVVDDIEGLVHEALAIEEHLETLVTFFVKIAPRFRKLRVA